MPKDFSRQLQEYQSAAIHLSSTPMVIYLESVKGCPYSCAMCHYRLTKPERVSRELLNKIEPHFPGLEVLTIHGAGEPLLGDLEYFVEQSKKHNFVLHMNTTAFFMTESISNLLAETRLSIRFSIHSGKPATYKKIMGHDFDRVKKNITYLLEKTKGSENTPDFWLSFIVIKENIEEIPEFIKLAHDLGIKNIRFVRLIPNWNSIKGVRMSDDFTFKYFEQSNNKIIDAFMKKLPEYMSLSNELGVNIKYGTMSNCANGVNNYKLMINFMTKFTFGSNLFPLKNNHGFCLAPWIGQLIISQNGNVRLCCLTNFSLGNLNESSLEEIWNSKKMKQIRKTFRDGYIPRICGFCQGFDFNNYPLNSFTEIPR
jgi:radical SAM protein with 4Fe4S-binding SPASM domain